MLHVEKPKSWETNLWRDMEEKWLCLLAKWTASFWHKSDSYWFWPLWVTILTSLSMELKSYCSLNYSLGSRAAHCHLIAKSTTVKWLCVIDLLGVRYENGTKMTIYFLKAFKGALHVLKAPKNIRQRAFCRVEVRQRRLFLHGYSMQSLLGAQAVSLLILWGKEWSKSTIRENVPQKRWTSKHIIPAGKITKCFVPVLLLNAFSSK